MFLYVNYPSFLSPYVLPFLPVRWYSVMYLVAFTVTYVLFRKQCKQGTLGYMNKDTSLDLFIFVIFGLILGARLGSCLIYEGSTYYLTHPWKIFWPFRNGKFIGLPGMSYHGGVIGAFIGNILFCRKYKYKALDTADALVCCIPLGYTFGRLGNFINGELWGRCTGTAYGMIFPEAPSYSASLDWVKEAADKAKIAYTEGSFINLPRHPSQLYEAFFEGIVLFLIMWFLIKPLVMKKKLDRGVCFGSYLSGYGLFRFIIEYFREPDSQIGFVIKLGKQSEPLALFRSFLNISMGQILCFTMIVCGIVLIVRGYHTPATIYKSHTKKPTV